MTIDVWLKNASSELADTMIASARLDAELILAHTIRRNRTYLHAHGDEEIDPRRVDIANARLQLRLERTPLAYIIGHKQFYGHNFLVTPATLIPRPESEVMVTLAKAWINNHSSVRHVVDVGTGSGCLGISLALECPLIDVTLIDVSDDALKIADKNSVSLGAKNIRTLKSNLLDKYPLKADVLLANLPYVNPEWNVDAETKFEPQDALFATDNGLELIKKLINQTPEKLARTGLLLLEADLRQHNEIIDYAKKSNLKLAQSEGLILGFTFQADA